MTVREYIGARYVPIFGRKDEENIEWDNSAPYEPLTVVLYQGNSYTSRQYVPAGVSIDNEEYWALTGNYSAQVDAYRRETQDVLETIDSNYTELKTSIAQNAGNILANSQAISEEATTRNEADSDLATLISLANARIDGIVSLPEGSTTGDAELMDARISNFGVTYENAGTAIRQQANSAQFSIDKLAKNGTITLPVSAFLQGAHASNGTAINTSKKFRIATIAKLTFETDVVIRAPYADYSFRGFVFDSPTATEGTYFSWTNSKALPAGQAINLEIRKTPEDEASIADYEEFITKIEVSSYINNGIEANNLARNEAFYWQRVDGDYLTIENASDGVYLNYRSNLLMRGYNNYGTFAITELGVTLTTSPQGVLNCIFIPINNFWTFNTATSTFAIKSRANVLSTDIVLLKVEGYPTARCYDGVLYGQVIEKMLMQADGRIDDVIENIEEYIATDYPAYYNNMILDKKQVINQNIVAAGYTGLNFAFVTDQHVEHNNLYGSALIRKLFELCPVTYVVNGGDIYDRDTTKNGAIEKIGEYAASFNWLRNQMFSVCGNHDLNSNAQGEYPERHLTLNEWASLALNGWFDFYDDYYDYSVIDTKSDTRMIFLQTTIATGQGAGNSFNATQAAALTSLLNSTTQANVIIVGHEFYDANDNHSTQFDAVIAAVAASSNASKVKCYISGHTHKDYSEHLASGALSITTANDGFKSHGQSGTTTETCFDVLSFDWTNNTLRACRFGYGNDRTFTIVA